MARFCGAGTAQPPYMRTKYMFIVQRSVYRAKVRLMPADAGGVVLSFTGFDPKRSSLWLSNCAATKRTRSFWRASRL
jgi:hypothetical protein